MLPFIIGLIAGGILGFAVCAICSMAGSDDHTQATKDTEDSDALNK